MRAGLAQYTSSDISNPWRAVVAGINKATDQLQEIWAICSRAQAAAHLYGAHKPLSGQALAKRGLTRADLPRAAFRALTG